MEPIFQVLRTYRNRIIVALLVIVLAALVWAIVWVVRWDNERSEACHNKGGVLVRTTCVDSRVVIPL